MLDSLYDAFQTMGEHGVASSASAPSAEMIEIGPSIEVPNTNKGKGRLPKRYCDGCRFCDGITPRIMIHLVHLSSQTAASSLKEDVSLNGSVSETESSCELKILLDRYTKNNDLPFDGVVQVIFGVSQGRKSFKVACTENGSVDALFSHLQRNGESRPGRVLEILDRASLSSSDVGERISGALQSWSSANVVRKTVAAQRKLLLEFSQICDSKLKLLESLKQSIPG